MIDGKSDVPQLIVPQFFGPDDTAAALAIVGEAFDARVEKSKYELELASADPDLPARLTLLLNGPIGGYALGVLGNATWAGIEWMTKRLREQFPGRAVSLEIHAGSGSRSADYTLDLESEHVVTALKAIPYDIEVEHRGPRIAYEVDEGWMTWDEVQDKKYRGRREARLEE